MEGKTAGNAAKRGVRKKVLEVLEVLEVLKVLDEVFGVLLKVFDEV